MSGLFKKFYSPRVFDVLFAVAGTLGLGGLIPATGNDYPAVVAATNPLAKAGALIAVLLGVTLLGIAGVRFDQKTADDYLFLTLTRSAYLAMFTFLFTVAFWELLLADPLGGLSSPVMIAILIGAWSLAYLYTRLRGTGAGA